jgi:hypothetical protein
MNLASALIFPFFKFSLARYFFQQVLIHSSLFSFHFPSPEPEFVNVQGAQESMSGLPQTFTNSGSVLCVLQSWACQIGSSYRPVRLHRLQESIPRLLKCLQIRALVCTLHYSNSLLDFSCYGSFVIIFLLRARVFFSFCNYYMLFAGVREKGKTVVVVSADESWRAGVVL